MDFDFKIKSLYFHFKLLLILLFSTFDICFHRKLFKNEIFEKIILFFSLDKNRFWKSLTLEITITTNYLYLICIKFLINIFVLSVDLSCKHLALNSMKKIIQNSSLLSKRSAFT
jgi:hypothetical protein